MLVSCTSEMTTLDCCWPLVNCCSLDLFSDVDFVVDDEDDVVFDIDDDDVVLVVVVADVDVIDLSFFDV